MIAAHNINRRSGALLIPVLLLASLWSAGCRVLPEPPGRYVEEIYHGTLENTQPTDVVVAPIVDESGVKGVPKIELRRAFQRNLIKRRYSALALPYTDQRVVNAGYKPGSLFEDAILKIVVRKWNLDRWQSNQEVAVEVEAWMVASEDETELWGGRFTKTFYLSHEMANRPTTKGAFDKTAELIASQLLEIMPARAAQP